MGTHSPDSGWKPGDLGELMFAGTQMPVTGGEEGELSVLEPSLLPFHTLAAISLSRALCCPISPLYSGCPVFLSFISSKTEDWGYLNEDGELGLAYQGLKQVARSNVSLSSCVYSFLPAHVYASLFFSWSGCKGAVHRVLVGSPLHRHLSLCVQALWIRSAEAASWGQGDSD